MEHGKSPPVNLSGAVVWFVHCCRVVQLSVLFSVYDVIDSLQVLLVIMVLKWTKGQLSQLGKAR